MTKKNTPIEAAEWHADARGIEIIWPADGVLVMWRDVDPTTGSHHHSEIPFTVQHPEPVIFEKRNGFRDVMENLFLNKQDAIDVMLANLRTLRKQYDEHFSWIERELRNG